MKHFTRIVLFTLCLSVSLNAAEEKAEKSGLKTGLFEWKDKATGAAGWAFVPENYNAEEGGLIVVNHGVQSDGKHPAGVWKKELKKQGIEDKWIIVSPTFPPIQKTPPGRLPKYTKEIAEKFGAGVTNTVEDFITKYNVNRLRVVLNGYSGGGMTMILVFRAKPELYKYMFLTSASYTGRPGLHEKMFSIPVMVLRGEKDHPLIKGQTPRLYGDFEKGKSKIGDKNLEKAISPGGKHALQHLNFSDTFVKWWAKINPVWEKEIVKIEEKKKKADRKKCEQIVKRLKRIKKYISRKMPQAFEYIDEINKLSYPTDEAEKLVKEVLKEVDAEYNKKIKRYLDKTEHKAYKLALRGLYKYRKRWKDVPYLLEKLEKDINRIEEMEKKTDK